MIFWQRVQEFARGAAGKVVVVVGDSLVESAAFAPILCGPPVIMPSSAAPAGTMRAGW
jgi:hypothetical protein